MHSTLPYYCETALNALGTFPYEPVNTITSFAPVLFGVLALVYLIRGGHADRVAYVLAGLTVLTGLGSVAWHSMRTPTTLFVDWFPGALYLLVVVSVWAAHAGGRYVGVVLLVVLAGLAFLVPFPTIRAFQFYIIGGLGAVAAALLAGTWFRRRAAFGWAAAMIASALVAVTFRTLDLSVCDTIPFGTHFFWHIFLGAAAYAGVRMMVRLRPGDIERSPSPSSG